MRLETGVVQEGDDWPGVFIRGDNAFAFRMAIDNVLGRLPIGATVGDMVSTKSLEELRDWLASCDVSTKPTVQKVLLVHEDSATEF